MELVSNESQDDSQASKIIYSFARNLGSKTFLQAASDLMEALTDPNAYKRDRLLSNLGGSIVPTVISDLAKTVDPIQRRTRTIGERIKARIPGQGEDLRPVVNIFGEPITEAHVGPVERFASPVKRRPVVHDPLLDELRRLEIDLDVPTDKLTVYDRPAAMGGGTQIPMSDSDKSALVQAKGQAIRRELDKVMERQRYQNADDSQREVLLNRAINDARDTVSNRARFAKRRGRDLTLDELLGVR
jgi:hypothetical protein